MRAEIIAPDSKAGVLPAGVAPIGIFDSGVGGLSVIRAIWKELPDEELLFLADQAHVPYGPRPLEEVRQFSEEITRFLLDQGAKLIVVACNAASAAALQYLRQTFPQTTFVGMEPAVKPAAEHSHSRVVAVLATPATFQGQLYASVVDRFAADTRLLQHTCPGLVQQIEAGDLDGPVTRRNIGRGAAADAGARRRHGGAWLYPLPVRDPADPGYRRSAGAGDRSGAGGRSASAAGAGSAGFAAPRPGGRTCQSQPFHDQRRCQWVEKGNIPAITPRNYYFACRMGRWEA